MCTNGIVTIIKVFETIDLMFCNRYYPGDNWPGVELSRGELVGGNCPGGIVRGGTDLEPSIYIRHITKGQQHVNSITQQGITPVCGGCSLFGDSEAFSLCFLQLHILPQQWQSFCTYFVFYDPLKWKDYTPEVQPYWGSKPYSLVDKISCQWDACFNRLMHCHTIVEVWGEHAFVSTI